MFTPANNNVTAPVTTAVFRLPRAAVQGGAAETFTAYMEDHRCTGPTTIATVGGIMLFLAADAAAGNPTSGASASLFRTGAAAALLALGTPPGGGAAPANENEENVVAANLNIGGAINWLANLINAAKKTPLTAGNVEGFFASLGHTGTSASPVVWLINSITPFYPDSIGDNGFRAMLAPGIWTTYRVARTSTGKIMWENIDAFRAVGISTAGDALELAIQASNAAPWDVTLTTQIGPKYKAYMCLYLEAAGTPIDNWYQGNSARNNLPAAKVRGAKEIFRRYLEIKNDVAGLNAITTTADLLASPTVNQFW